ncbi:MAG TPA: hypothetical protein VNI83_11335 [Vicinamibacterales bacterium]|nr:hypothetical protein [Vicinamibacterales bacterium]
MNAPFDKSLPSPIAAVLELRASSEDSVVIPGRLSDVQRRQRIKTAIGERILEEVRGPEPPTVVLISGSAGGGKSLEISELAEHAPNEFERILEDATHAEAPDQDQHEQLVDFFAPLRDGAPPATGKPRLIAMNTGMVIRFFDQLREVRGEAHGFTALEARLRERLELPRAPLGEAELPGRVLVVNLDLRPTAGGNETLFARMLAALDPDDPDGIMGGAPRCGTCAVRDWCFVRTNAKIISGGAARDALDGAAEELARERGRFLQPRALWDLAADVVTGGEPFDQPDPCDRIAELAAAGDPVPVWQRIASNGAFVEPRGLTAASLRQLDPSYRPSDRAHELFGRTGIEPAADAQRLRDYLGGGGREAVETAATALERLLEDDGAVRVPAARGLVRAAALAGEFAFAAAGADAFRGALTEYRAFPDADSDYHELHELRGLLARALALAFGEIVGAESFFRTEAYDPRRDYAVLVGVEIEQELRPVPDPRRLANPEGATLVGYEPLAVAFELAGVRLDLDLPLYRLVLETVGGTTPSSADLERFYGLRRAAEALGRIAADDHSRPLLITERLTGGRFRVAQTPDLRGQPNLTVRPVH